MTTAVREEWRVDCRDCDLQCGPYNYRATAVAERALHEVTHPAHHATVQQRIQYLLPL